MFYLCVCLSVCLLDYLKTYQQILMKFVWKVMRGPRTNRLDFGDDPINDPYSGIFKRTCLY